MSSTPPNVIGHLIAEASASVTRAPQNTHLDDVEGRTEEEGAVK